MPGITGCGCLILVALIVGLIFFLIFGSTDAGEPIDAAVAIAIAGLLLTWVAGVPLRRALVGARGA